MTHQSSCRVLLNNAVLEAFHVYSASEFGEIIKGWIF
jgi:hypothetical protein